MCQRVHQGNSEGGWTPGTHQCINNNTTDDLRINGAMGHLDDLSVGLSRREHVGARRVPGTLECERPSPANVRHSGIWVAGTACSTVWSGSAVVSARKLSCSGQIRRRRAISGQLGSNSTAGACTTVCSNGACGVCTPGDVRCDPAGTEKPSAEMQSDRDLGKQMARRCGALGRYAGSCGACASRSYAVRPLY